jgi:hypothetical protein
MAIVVVTCKTQGCLNFNIDIPFENPAEIVICGFCHNQISGSAPVQPTAEQLAALAAGQPISTLPSNSSIPQAGE